MTATTEKIDYLSNIYKMTDTFKPLAGIYMFENKINGKLYIGESLNVRRRMSNHRNYEYDSMLFRATKKYGFNNFDIYVEYFPDFKKKDLLDLEEQLIKRCGTLKPNGYNVLPRGTDFSGIPKSEEHKRKLSIAHTGKTYSDEYKQNMSKIQMGRKFTKQTKDRMYNSSKKGEDNHGSILTENQVREIRLKYIPFKYPMKKLASEYGGKRITIQKLIKRVTWKHIN